MAPLEDSGAGCAFQPAPLSGIDRTTETGAVPCPLAARSGILHCISETKAEHVDAARLAKGLREILPAGRVIDAPSELIAYSTDASFYSHLRPRPPDIVVVARSTEDVQKTVAFAYEHDVPITPRGASSGQTGGSIPVRGGIVGPRSVLLFDIAERIRLGASVGHTPKMPLLTELGNPNCGWFYKDVAGAGVAP